MKTNILKNLLGVTLVIITLFFTSNTLFASDTQDVAFNMTEALQKLGLVAEMPISLFNDVYSSMHNNVMPNIGRATPDTPIIITSEADVDVLLAFAEIAVEQNFNFSWDICIDIILAETGLYYYWREGFRELTRPGRERQLEYFATMYTLAELNEMGLFDRYGMMEEFHTLGFFLDEPIKNIGSERVSITPFGVLNRTIPQQTLDGSRWTSPIILLNGDNLTFVITTHAVSGVAPWPYLRAGLGVHGADGVFIASSDSFMPGPISFDWRSRRSFEASGFTNAFRIIESSHSTQGASVSGTYRITW